MEISEENKLVMFFIQILKHYNHNAYWRMREKVVNPESKTPAFLKVFYLYRIKRMDAFNLSSMGTGYGWGAEFATPPILPHLLNGIIISHYAKIGKNCVINQQVTIAEHNKSAATIGDNVMIGAGAKILKAVTIGNNVRIGANAVVVTDLPSNCTAVGNPAHIVKYHTPEESEAEN